MMPPVDPYRNVLPRIVLAVLGCGAWVSPVRCQSTTGSVDQTERRESADREKNPPPYSKEVLDKAVDILDAAGLRVSGSKILSSRTSPLARALTALAKQRRELKQTHQLWQQAVSVETNIRNELQRLNVQYGQFNLQLAAAQGADPRTENRIVAMINATAARMKQIAGRRESVQAAVNEAAAKLRDAEADYSRVVLAIRGDLDDIRGEVEKALTDRQVRIALSVTHRNLGTPENVTADDALSSIETRLTKVEDEIFRETIALENEGGGLYVPVVVGDRTVRMVVDSGATIVSLPARVATELGVTIPQDAPRIEMELADGRVIGARGVVLPKVRVGAFEASDVRAAVLDASADRAVPLLGLSFLGQFKFEIDTAGRTLQMLRVDAD